MYYDWKNGNLKEFSLQEDRNATLLDWFSNETFYINLFVPKTFS